MGGFLLLAENRSVPYPRSPFSFGHLLHLLYEFAPANQGLVPTWRPASMKALRLRARRASIIVLRPASATRHNPDRWAASNARRAMIRLLLGAFFLTTTGVSAQVLCGQSADNARARVAC